VTDSQRRLVQCFTAVFADLSEQQAAVATIDSVSDWDSIATVTLVSLIEEEFQIHIASDALAQLASFDAFYRYLEARSPANDLVAAR
jgi:acyl carrier protein